MIEERYRIACPHCGYNVGSLLRPQRGLSRVQQFFYLHPEAIGAGFGFVAGAVLGILMGVLA